MKVKVEGEDDLIGYVSIKKLANRGDCYKYKLMNRVVMASQSSDASVCTGFINAESEQDAMSQVTRIVHNCTQGAEGSEAMFNSETIRKWCFTFIDSLRVQFPASSFERV